MDLRIQDFGYYEDEVKECRSEKDLLDFIDDHSYDMTRTDWHYVTKHPKFTIKIALLYPEKVGWEYICTFRKLTEAEIEKCIKYINWYEVSAFQKLSIGFIKKYKDKLSLDAIMCGDKLSQADRNEFIQLFDKNNDPKHHKVWDENLQKAKIFCPKIFRSKYNDYPGARMDEEPKKSYGVYQWAAPALEAKNKKEETKTTKRSTKPKKKEEKVEVKVIKKETKKPVKKTKKEVIDYSVLTKAQLKEILDKRKVRYLYHDTIDILRKKCKESE